MVAPIWFPRTLGNVQLIIYNSAKALGKEFYKILPHYKEKTISIIFQLNLTFGILQRELLGVTNLGGGALKFSRYDIGLFYIIDNFEISTNRFKNFLLRKQKSVMEELGLNFSPPIREQEPNPLPDRKAVDDIVFDVLGLTEEERKEVYWAVAELVKNRLEKAKSV